MAIVQVILNGMPSGTMHDTESYDVVLQFDETKSYEDALWIIPSYPGHIPGYMLSEIRVEKGEFTVSIDGPEGFQSGPHTTNWVRGGYPRGKDVSLLLTNAETRQMTGVTVEVVEGSLITGELVLGGPKPTT